MIDVALQLSVGFPREEADHAFAFAESGLPVDIRGPNGGRMTIDPKTKLARVQVEAEGAAGVFIASAELPTEALAACFDLFRSKTTERGAHAIIGLQFPVSLTLSQGQAVRRAMENAEELVIELAAGTMTIGRAALDISADVVIPILDPLTRLPVEGGASWNVHGAFHLGGQARAVFLERIVERIADERAKN